MKSVNRVVIPFLSKSIIMKTKCILLFGFCLAFSYNSQAQILKKLKKKAEQAVERTILRKTDEEVSKTTEKTIDGVTGKNDNKDSKSDNLEPANSALEKNTEAKRDFFKEDAVINLFENGNLNQTQYFDSNSIALRTNQNDSPKPTFIDSEGFLYTYQKGEYTKSSLIALQSQGMMVPTMLLEAYMLPQEPFMAQLQKQHDLGLTANPFNGFVEFAFIYKPDDFRYQDYKETTQTIRGRKHTKFELLNEPGYKGNYVLFDDKDRLVEVYSNKLEGEQSMDDFTQMSMVQPGESLLVYEYKPVEVELPQAREVKTRGQGLMEMTMGGIAKGGQKNGKNIDEDDYDTSNSKGSVKSMKKALKNHKTTVDDLPDSYEFNWELKTEMVMGKKGKDVMEMTFLINENANYQATKMVDANSKNNGEATMLFDSDLKTMVMFMDAQGSKFLQMYPIPEVAETNSASNNYNISELPSKTIIGYKCEGLQLEDDRYILKVYHTAEANIKLSNFLSFGNQNQKMDLPDIDPKVSEQFSNGLILQMDIIDKKKAKNNVNIIAKSLKKESVSIKKSDYKTMNFFSGRNMSKN